VHVPTIHRIRIEKFRRIQEPLDLDFTSPRGEAGKTIVLAGPNGCGKTSILEAVLLGLGQEYLIVRDEEKAKREQHWRTNLPADAKVEIDVSVDGGPVETWCRTADDLEILQRRNVNPAEMEMSVEYFSSWRSPELVGAIKPLAGPGGRPTEREANRLWRLKQRINDERARGGYQQQIPGTQSRDKVWLDRINGAWSRFHGEDGTRIDAAIVDSEDDELLADLFVMRGEERICSVDQVSSGELELLSFAGWIILNDFKGGLLIIDEPELHLHPQWQSTFLPALRELAPDAQFLVASHSPAVWDQAFSFERFLLLQEGDLRSSPDRRALPSVAE
jgi:predicted ATPase